MKIEEILSRNVEQIITKEELLKKFRAGRKLRIKHGVDATSPLLHLGHAVDYWKMREFQELGHKVVFIIGDFTTQIGDPAGRLKARPEISKSQAEKNTKTYLAQATKILINKPGLLEVRKNSEWYGKMKASELLSLLKKVTHARLIERSMFQRRIEAKQEIYAHELVYPILQGYDSVVVNSDLTVIGSDQLFNEMMGRHFQEIFGQAPQVIITTPITPGLDGKEKMSKSLGNYIAILDPPREKFGKIMSLPDRLIETYLKVYTRLSLQAVSEVMKLSPLKAKERLAYELVKLYHREKKANQASEFFRKTFREKELPKDVRTVYFDSKNPPLMVELLAQARIVPSNSEFRRLLRQGAIEFDQKVVSSPNFVVGGAGTIRVGKKKFLKIVPK